jgi:hypothetical protein
VLCKHEVVGSIPSGSTTSRSTATTTEKIKQLRLQEIAVADFDIVKAG